MTPEILSILRCPYCRGTFVFGETPHPKPLAAACGILRCGCGAFPVIDGIPILKKTPISPLENGGPFDQADGVPVAELVRLLEAGRAVDALLECLAVPGRRAAAAVSRLAPQRIARGEGMRRLLRFPAKWRLLRLLAKRDSLSARAVLEFFFTPESALGQLYGTFFIMRFCQPRNLAALSLLATLPGGKQQGSPGGKPILDIACGLGHLEHYLTGRADPAASVGTDMNFFHVWMARHWFAPAGAYVCADASEGLPFADGSFSATLCADAFHYIPNRHGLLGEIERCAPGRPVFIIRVGNSEVMPNEGTEQSLLGYLGECSRFGEGVHAYSEAELVEAYLRGKNPLTRPDRVPPGLDRVKWLSLAWNIGAELRERAPAKDDPPHAVGRIGINPIYRVSRRAQGRTLLRFEFPLPWYAYENHGMLAYHPQYVDVPDAGREALQAWRDNADLAKLVDSFVMIGMPERFDSP